MKHKFKLGDIVQCVSDNWKNDQLLGKIGKILDIDNHPLYPYTVKFFDPIKYGHDRYGRGEDGCCRFFEKNEIELYLPILKLFLKEKKDGSL